MPTREAPESDEIYHIYNRGVDKRKIFLSDKDYFRFIHDIYEFNDSQPSLNVDKKLPSQQFTRQRKPIVEIFAFCLMPNHFHLMLRQIVDGGITLFMRKLGTGYTNSFNLKYKRTGSLFQGRYKFVRLAREAHFLYLPHYIHLNPKDLLEQGYSQTQIIEFLKNYKWSSFPDYVGIKNYPSVIDKEFMIEQYGNEKKYLADLEGWLKDADKTGLEKILIDA